MITGYCYQFNSNGSFSSQSAGISGGLTVYLDAQVYEYATGPSSYSEGFSVSVYICYI